MVTVIDNYGYNNNLFEGMSVSDAASQLVIEANNIASDMMMDILLTEHSYLYENATEIRYVNEAGEETPEGANLKSGILDKIKAFGALIASAFKRLKESIAENVSRIVALIRSKMINRTEFNNALNQYADDEVSYIIGYGDQILSKLAEPKKYFIMANTEAEIKAISDEDIKKSGDVKKEILGEYEKRTGSTVGNSMENLLSITFDNGKKYISAINSSEKFANQTLRNVEKLVKMTKGEDAPNVISKIAKCISSNSITCKDLINVYNTVFMAHVKCAISIIKKMRKEDSDAKAAKKEAEKKAKQAEGKSSTFFQKFSKK